MNDTISPVIVCVAAGVVIALGARRHARRDDALWRPARALDVLRDLAEHPRRSQDRFDPTARPPAAHPR